MFAKISITPLGEHLYDFVKKNLPQWGAGNLDATFKGARIWWEHQFAHIRGSGEYGVALMYLLRGEGKTIPLHGWYSNGTLYTLCLEPFGKFSLRYMKNEDCLCLALRDVEIADYIARFSLSSLEEPLLLTELIDVAVQRDILRMKAERVERESPGSIAHVASLGAESERRIRTAFAPDANMSDAEARAVTATQE